MRERGGRSEGERRHETSEYSLTQDRHRRRHFRSPSPSLSPSPSPSPSRRHGRRRDRRRRRSPSPDRRRRRSPSPDRRRTRLRVDDGEKSRHRSEAAEEGTTADVEAVSDFVDGIAREHQKKQRGGGGDGEEGKLIPDADEVDLMVKLGFPVGFESTKGKQVVDANVSGVRAVTKRQPRQYMNRRGGFNRPLPVERNR